MCRSRLNNSEITASRPQPKVTVFKLELIGYTICFGVVVFFDTFTAVKPINLYNFYLSSIQKSIRGFWLFCFLFICDSAARVHMEKLKKKAIILNNYQLKLKAGFALMLVS